MIKWQLFSCWIKERTKEHYFWILNKIQCAYQVSSFWRIYFFYIINIFDFIYEKFNETKLLCSKKSENIYNKNLYAYIWQEVNFKDRLQIFVKIYFDMHARDVLTRKLLNQFFLHFNFAKNKKTKIHTCVLVIRLESGK